MCLPLKAAVISSPISTLDKQRPAQLLTTTLIGHPVLPCPLHLTTLAFQLLRLALDLATLTKQAPGI